MRTLILVVFSLMMFNLSAQTYEIGVFAGGANYIGDVGSTSYISPNTTVYGGLFKWNRSVRYSWRASIKHATIKGDDAKSDIASRKERNFDFENKLTEFSLGLEVNFIKFNLHKMAPQWSPYLYTGLTYTLYDDMYYNGGLLTELGQKGTVAIPMTIGVKKSIGRFFVIGAEIGARYAFTDNLDASNPGKPAAGQTDFRIGNIYSDDWYVFSGITFTYTFGRKPCYDCVDN